MSCNTIETDLDQLLDRVLWRVQEGELEATAALEIIDEYRARIAAEAEK